LHKVASLIWPCARYKVAGPGQSCRLFVSDPQGQLDGHAFLRWASSHR
jgi:hypothetical protein